MRPTLLPVMSPTLLTAKEAAARLRISLSALYREARAGRIPPVKILGGRVLFSEATLAEVIRKAETANAGRDHETVAANG